MTCPICRSETDPQIIAEATLGGDTRFDVVECVTCAASYLSPLPTSNQLESLYSPRYYGSDWYKQLGWGAAFAKYSLPKKSGKFLDVGCGLGFFIEGIKKNSNWEVHGIEFTAGATDYARNVLGLDVRQGEVVDMHYADTVFDYIQIRNVLEHVRDPMTLLRECRRILKPDGVLELHVPNGRVDRIDLIKFYRSCGDPPFSKSGHLFFFPKKTLIWMFEEIGLKLVRSRTYGIRRGLAHLGFWPRFKDWKRPYIPKLTNNRPGNSDIVLPPGKRRPSLYYTYRIMRMNMRMLPGMREFGLDYQLFLVPKQERETENPRQPS